jgi:hypothetical protein
MQIYGDVAVVHQPFTMNFADRLVSAMDVFSLARIDGVWKVVSVVSDTMGAA